MLRVNEYRGDPSNPSWGVSQAQVAFYSPHIGMLRFQVGFPSSLENLMRLSLPHLLHLSLSLSPPLLSLPPAHISTPPPPPRQVGVDGYTEDEVWYVAAIDGTTRAPTACTREVCPLRPPPDRRRYR